MQGFRPHQYLALAAALLLHAWVVEHLLFSNSRAGKPIATPESIITVSLDAAANSAAPADEAPSAEPTPAEPDARTTADNEAPDASVPTENGPRYYKPRELSDAPILRQDVLQDQPIHPSGDGPRKVILHIYINDNGDVDNIVPEGSELSFEDTKTLVEKFSHMKFTPGKRNGVAVPVELKIEVEATAVH